MPTLETSAGTVTYDERGEGPTLIMLPSGAHERHDFDEPRKLLPGLRTVAVDWPGHGSPPAPAAGRTSAMACADATEELVERLAPEGAIVLGNSVGGFAAGRLAIRRPELVRGLVLVDSGGFAARTPVVHAFCALMSRPWFLRRIYPAFAKRYMRPRTRTGADRRALAAAVATTRDDPGLATVCGLWGSFASPRHDLRRKAGSIAAPTLVVWGRRDPVIPLRIGRKVAASIPGAELVVLETGHVPSTSDPEGFAAALAPFAERVLASPGTAAK